MSARFAILWFVLVGLMAGQLAVASHSALHPDHGISLAAFAADRADEADGHAPHAPHQKPPPACADCVLAKSLQAAFPAMQDMPAGPAAFVAAPAPSFTPAALAAPARSARRARAPPFLI